MLGAEAAAGLPAGNLLAAAGIAAPPAAVLLMAKARRMRLPSLVVFILAAAWLPVSALLAGNAKLVFSDETHGRFEAWVVATGVLALADLVLLTWSVLVNRGQPRNVRNKPRI